MRAPSQSVADIPTNEIVPLYSGACQKGHMDNLAKAERRVPELDCHGKTCLVLHAHAISSEYPIFFDIHRATGVEEHHRVTPEPILQPPQHRCLHILLIQLVKES